MMTTELRPRKETLYEDGPATAAMSDNVHNLIQMLSVKLDAVWRYDKYMDDCEGDDSCSTLFGQMKEEELRHIQMLRDEIQRHCKEGTFR